MNRTKKDGLNFWKTVFDTETNPTHTPKYYVTPEFKNWQELENWIDSYHSEVRRKYVRRAVNAHEELLRWAKQYAFDCEHNEPHLKGGNLDLLKQAIAKAEGRS